MLASCPPKISLWPRPGGCEAGPACRNQLRQRDAQHDQIFHRRACEGARACHFEEGREEIRTSKWTSAGFEDEYQETRIQEGWPRPVARIPREHARLASRSHHAGKKRSSCRWRANIVLTGRMDQVNRIAPGEEEIVDYKTGKPKDEDKAKKDLPTERGTRPRGPGGVRLESRAAHVLQPADEPSRERGRATTRNSTRYARKFRKPPPTIRAGKFPPKTRLSGASSATFESICPAREQGAAASASG